MSFEIKEFGKNIGLSIVENCTSGFFNGAVEMIEDSAKKKSERSNALEGVKSESIKEKVDIVINEYCNELNEATAYYSENELKNMFENIIVSIYSMDKDFLMMIKTRYLKDIKSSLRDISKD